MFYLVLVVRFALIVVLMITINGNQKRYDVENVGLFGKMTTNKEICTVLMGYIGSYPTF